MKIVHHVMEIQQIIVNGQKQKASCAAATYSGLNQTACEGIKSYAWDTSTCKSAKACSELTNISNPTCGDTSYCVWTNGETGNCATVDCTKNNFIIIIFFLFYFFIFS